MVLFPAADAVYNRAALSFWLQEKMLRRLAKEQKKTQNKTLFLIEGLMVC